MDSKKWNIVLIIVIVAMAIIILLKVKENNELSEQLNLAKGQVENLSKTNDDLKAEYDKLAAEKDQLQEYYVDSTTENMQLRINYDVAVKVSKRLYEILQEHNIKIDPNKEFPELVERMGSMLDEENTNDAI